MKSSIDKPNNLKKLFHFSVFAFLALSPMVIASCGGGGGGGGGIFAAIEQEEKLNKSTVPWIARGLCACGDFYYTTNGEKVFKKSASDYRGKWEGCYTAPGNRGIANVASDGTNVYIMTYNKTLAFDEDEIKSYGYSDTSVFTLEGAAVSVSGIESIFDNKYYAGYGAGGRAYALTKGGCYELNGASATLVAGGVSAAYVNDASVFSDGYIVSNQNHTASYWIKSNGDASFDYQKEVVLNKGGEIRGLAYFVDKNGNHYLLIGTEKVGYFKVEVGGNKTEACGDSSEANAAQFSNFGCVAGCLWTMPSPEGDVIYLTPTNPRDKTHSGLWSYYPDGKYDKWNME